jgi:hypothetical protein
LNKNNDIENITLVNVLRTKSWGSSKTKIEGSGCRGFELTAGHLKAEEVAGVWDNDDAALLTYCSHTLVEVLLQANHP